MQKNIVHFGKYYYPDLGGIESVTVTLARGAAAAGHDVSVVCFSHKTQLPAKSDGVMVFKERAPIVLASQPLSLKYIWRCISQSRGADIVHLHAPNFLAYIAVLFIPKTTPLLVHWHSDVLGRHFWKKFLQPLEVFLLRRAVTIVATSRAYANASKALSLFQDKVVCIPIGVQPTASNNHTSPCLVEPHVRGKRIILAVGRLVEYKGFEHLITASEFFDDNTVTIIVGNGPLYKKLQNIIDSKKLNDKVIMVGRLEKSELSRLFCDSALFCLTSTSRAEAFGVVLIEALAHGLPIVASDIPGSGVPWVNLHGVSGFNVPVGDARAIADAVNHIIRSEGVRRKMSHGAIQRFVEEFTEEKFIARVLAIYDELGKGTSLS